MICGICVAQKECYSKPLASHHNPNYMEEAEPKPEDPFAVTRARNRLNEAIFR